MFKKIFSFVLATILVFGTVTVSAYAEDVTEPAIEEDVYIPVAHNIADIVAEFEDGESYYINPTDTILLYATEEPEEGETEEEETEAPAYSEVLIVEYVTDFNDGSESVSAGGYTKFVEYTQSGYEVLGIGQRTQYAMKGNTKESNKPIDFESGEGYTFSGWRVKAVYSGKEFNRVTLVAEWEAPELHGWEGFLELFRGYMKILIDAVTAYLGDLFTRIGAFFV